MATNPEIYQETTRCGGKLRLRALSEACELSMTGHGSGFVSVWISKDMALDVAKKILEWHQEK